MCKRESIQYQYQLALIQGIMVCTLKEFLCLDFLEDIPFEVTGTAKKTSFGLCHWHAIFQSELNKMQSANQVRQLKYHASHKKEGGGSKPATNAKTFLRIPMILL